MRANGGTSEGQSDSLDHASNSVAAPETSSWGRLMSHLKTCERFLSLLIIRSLWILRRDRKKAWQAVVGVCGAVCLVWGLSSLVFNSSNEIALDESAQEPPAVVATLGVSDLPDEPVDLSEVEFPHHDSALLPISLSDDTSANQVLPVSAEVDAGGEAGGAWLLGTIENIAAEDVGRSRRVITRKPVARRLK